MCGRAARALHLGARPAVAQLWLAAGRLANMHAGVAQVQTVYQTSDEDRFPMEDADLKSLKLGWQIMCTLKAVSSLASSHNDFTLE